MKKTLLVLLALTVLYPMMLLGENLDSLPEAKRNARLLEMAKQVVMKHGPGYYRDVFPPVIVHGLVSPDNRECTLQQVKQHNGRSYYKVEYSFDEKQESFEWSYAARTYIWGDTGISFSVIFGNGWGFEIDQATRSANEKEQFMPFKKQPPHVPYKPERILHESRD